MFDLKKLCFWRELRQIINTQTLFYTGHFIHHCFKAIVAEKLVFIVFKFFSQTIILMF